MIECVIFDLSEVLIAGLLGVERPLSPELGVPQDEILPLFGGDRFIELLLGDISEDSYLRHVIARAGWEITSARLKAVIRGNFHNQVAGSLPILEGLAGRVDLALLSDHAREWIAYIKRVHPFMRTFKRTFFSYDLQSTKSDPGTFRRVVEALSVPPARCLFVDDNLKNVEVARSVGITSIWFRDAGQLAAELAERGV